MTTASPPNADDRKERSHSFLTAAEIEQIEDDPVLTVPAVLEYRARSSTLEREPDAPPTYECTSCGGSTHDPSRICPDCHLEERGRSR